MSFLKPVILKLCEFHSFPQIHEVSLKLLNSLYDSDDGILILILYKDINFNAGNTPWAADAIGFEPLGRFVYKSSGISIPAINIICRIANKGINKVIGIESYLHFFRANKSVPRLTHYSFLCTFIFRV